MEKLPSRFWEIAIEETWHPETEEEIEEVWKWIQKNGIPYDPNLPFN